MDPGKSIHGNGSGPRLPSADRPRERLQALGARALSEAELLALVVGSGCPGETVDDLARRLVAGGGGLRGLARRHLEQWRKERGIGAAGAARLVAVFEIARRLRARAPEPGDPVRRPRDVAGHLSARYGDQHEECFGVILLDARNRLVREQVLSRGGWSASVVRPREVFRQALMSGSPAVILFHNHPSGDPSPSGEDVRVTRQIADAGELLGIRVLDHLVVGREGFASLRERGLM